MASEQPESSTAAAAATTTTTAAATTTTSNPTTEAAAGPAVPAQDKDKAKDEEKKRLGKLIRKLTVKKDGTKRFSGFFSPKAGPSSAIPEDKEDVKGKKPETEENKKSPYEDLEGVVRVPKLKLFEERAQALGQRFGLEINASEWQSTEGTALRIEKPIRMRVRRTCHECNATFGKDRECPSCKHLRCSKCIRSPPRRTEAERAATRARVATHIKEQKDKRDTYIVPDWDADCKKMPPLTRPARCPHQDLIRKKPRQRIRRNCHVCSALFRGSNKTCEECGHTRCTDCPRDPPKKDKYPYGYPGDEFGPNSIPYYQCVACKKVYDEGAPDGTPCTGCGFKKTPACPRMKPQKVEPVPDPEILKSLEAKLAELSVDAH